MNQKLRPKNKQVMIIASGPTVNTLINTPFFSRLKEIDISQAPNWIGASARASSVEIDIVIICPADGETTGRIRETVGNIAAACPEVAAIFVFSGKRRELDDERVQALVLQPNIQRLTNELRPFLVKKAEAAA